MSRRFVAEITGIPLKTLNAFNSSSDRSILKTNALNVYKLAQLFGVSMEQLLLTECELNPTSKAFWKLKRFNMNIDNALYALNIAPDARQLTVFIDGEAIPQSRPKIATRGKMAFRCPMLSPTIKTLPFTIASNANTVLNKLFKSQVSF